VWILYVIHATNLCCNLINTMGSSASISADAFPEDISNKYQESSAMKEEIAKRDAAFIHQQANQSWKNHKLIIAALTERTKSQLQRVAVIYGKMEERSKPANIEIRDMLGGNYGEFMSLLLVKREIISADLLNVAFKCIGCDECLVADVLCACSSFEMEETQHHFNSTNSLSLVDTVTNKTLEKSSFQKFILKILNTKRKDDDEVDDVQALVQMQEIHAAGAAKDEVTIFNIVSRESRAQCDLISRHYESTHQTTLGEALGKVFAGSTQRALLLFVSPLLASIASLFYLSLHSTVVDFDMTCRLATKYNKSKLQAALVVYKTLYTEDLVDQLNKKLTGNFKKSVIAWLTAGSYDKGNESKIEDMVEDCDGDITKLLADPAKLAALRELVEAENAACKQHMKDLDIAAAAVAGKKPPGKTVPAPPAPAKEEKEEKEAASPALSALSRSSSIIDTAAKDCKEEEAAAKDCKQETVLSEDKVAAAMTALETEAPEEAEKPAAAAATMMFASPSKRKEMGYEDKFKLICDYMLERFKQVLQYREYCFNMHHAD
jgi:hypothetical protein